jgi:hypothetical protein
MNVTSRLIRNSSFAALIATLPLAHAAVRPVDALTCVDHCYDCQIIYVNCLACSGSGCDMVGYGCSGGCWDCGSGVECGS